LGASATPAVRVGLWDRGPADMRRRWLGAPAQAARAHRHGRHWCEPACEVQIPRSTSSPVGRDAPQGTCSAAPLRVARPFEAAPRHPHVCHQVPGGAGAHPGDGGCTGEVTASAQVFDQRWVLSFPAESPRGAAAQLNATPWRRLGDLFESSSRVRQSWPVLLRVARPARAHWAWIILPESSRAPWDFVEGGDRGRTAQGGKVGRSGIERGPFR